MEQQIGVIGLDLAKSVFQVRGIDDDGPVVVRRKLSRSQILVYSSKLEPLDRTDRCFGSQGKADADAICEPLRKEPKEQHGRRRSDLWGSDAPNNANIALVAIGRPTFNAQRPLRVQKRRLAYKPSSFKGPSQQSFNLDLGIEIIIRSEIAGQPRILPNIHLAIVAHCELIWRYP